MAIGGGNSIQLLIPILQHFMNLIQKTNIMQENFPIEHTQILINSRQ